MQSSYFTEMEFTIESGLLVVPKRIQESHLTDELPDEALVQAIGRHLLVTIPSDRDNIQFAFPFEEWMVGDVQTRSLSQKTLNLSEWLPNIRGDEEGEKLVSVARVVVMDERWELMLDE